MDTCEGACGGQSDAGCWCDSACFAAGDCCDDVCDFCSADFPQDCGLGCGADEVEACDGSCVPDWWVGDDYCDSVLNCVEYNYDAGDCVPADTDCCIDNGSPGCDFQPVQDCVCAFDAYCCDTEWDGLCADEAVADCGLLCQ